MWDAYQSLRDCGRWDSRDPNSSDKGSGRAPSLCRCTDPDWECTAVEVDHHWKPRLTFATHWLILGSLPTLSNISNSLALGWCMVHMMVRPPRARERIRETTWQHDTLSKPLKRETEIFFNRYYMECCGKYFICVLISTLVGFELHEYAMGCVEECSMTELSDKYKVLY